MIAVHLFFSFCLFYILGMFLFTGGARAMDPGYRKTLRSRLWVAAGAAAPVLYIVSPWPEAAGYPLAILLLLYMASAWVAWGVMTALEHEESAPAGEHAELRAA